MKIRTVWLGHPTAEALEDYALRRLGEAETASVERHLLACETCQASLQNIDEFILAMRENALLENRAEGAQTGSAARPESSRWRTATWFDWKQGWHSVTPGRAGLAGAMALLCGVAMLHGPKTPDGPPTAVTLTALRGGGPAQAATAPSGRALALTINVGDIPAATPCRVVVADEMGSEVWSGSAATANGQVNVKVDKALGRGIFWVRVYTSGAEPAREFGLRLE